MATSLNITAGTGKILSEQDVQILQKLSTLDEKEMRKTHAEFWEEFPDGKMSKESFIKYYQLVLNDDRISEKNWDDAFSVFDLNHDGIIDFAEYLFMLACNSNKDLAKTYGDLFQMRNISGSGQMDKNELISFLEYVLKNSGETFGPDDRDSPTVATMIFNMVGVDENGSMNKEQFIIG